ncbi:MAG: MBL fold metallo-hydrolase [Bacteroidetes bacterium]|nr:MBL fold metallo-hydrolase [Bacteroidota bacterium]
MEISFHWVGGATWILNIDDLKIACDPVLCPKGTIQDYFWFKSKRIEAPAYEEKDFDNTDIWLITHNHEDHLDQAGLSKIADTSMVISNPNAAPRLEKKGVGNLHILKRDSRKILRLRNFQIEITAIPAIHGINPISAFFAGRGNGYFLTIEKENKKFSFYLTGDTVYKKQIVKKLRNKNIDLLIPNMGAVKQGSWLMTLTLNANMLKRFLSELHPKMVIPVHYGSFAHYNEPASAIAEIKDDRIKMVEVGGSYTFRVD